MAVIKQCMEHTYNSLFPKKLNNKKSVFAINILHIIGILLLQIGIFLPPRYMKYYIIYIVILLITYIILNNRCFMTELSNYISGYNYNMLCFNLNDTKKLLLAYLLAGILFDSYPEYSLYTLLSKLVSSK